MYVVDGFPGRYCYDCAKKLEDIFKRSKTTMGKEIRVIFDNGGGKWLYYKGEDGAFLHEYRCDDVEQLVRDAMTLASGLSPIEEDWDGNEIGDYYPIFDSEKDDAKELPLFPAEQENVGWWEV